MKFDEELYHVSITSSLLTQESGLKSDGFTISMANDESLLTQESGLKFFYVCNGPV